jgi:protein-disulfide isomerase
MESMSRTKQNLPRAFREPARRRSTPQAAAWRRTRFRVWLACIGILAAAAVLAMLAFSAHTNSQAVTDAKVEREVNALLAGTPQRQTTLGNPTAPVTLEIFLDLKDPDSRSWFLIDLPAIIRQYVRPGALKLRYHAYKTNTFSPQEFVRAQTAALAAGAQNRLWSFIDTFYHEQGDEHAHYATEPFLDHIASQVPDLNLARWHTDRHTGRREEQTTSEDQNARALGLHVTPSFRIGRTGHAAKNFVGHAIIKYGEQHPIALPTTQDIHKAIQELH